MAAARQLPIAIVRRPSLAAAAVGIALAVSAVLAGTLNIWQDEAYTLHSISSGAAFAFHEALAFEQNAPLYFVILALLHQVSGSVFFLRLFSVACAVGAVTVVPAIMRRYVPTVDPGLPTLVVALNPFLIWAAVEMRVYALVILLSAVLLLLCYDAFLAERPRRSSALLYAACAAVALYTQYYLLFLIAAQAVAVLIFRRSALGRFALAALVALLLFAPLAFVVPGQVQNFRGAFARPTLVGEILAIAAILARYALPLLIHHAKLAYVLLATLLAAAVYVGRRSFASSCGSALLVTTGFAAAFFALGTYAAGVHILNRHVASLYIPTALLPFAAIGMLRDGVRARLAIVWSVAALAVSSVALMQTYAHMAKPGDWISVNAYLSDNERANEPIVVFEAENALPLEFYYRGANRIVPIPKAVDFHRYDVSDFIIRDAAQMHAAMPREKRVWFVNAGGCASAEVRFGCEVVERYISAHYRTVKDELFDESRARLLEKIPK